MGIVPVLATLMCEVKTEIFWATWEERVSFLDTFRRLLCLRVVVWTQTPEAIQLVWHRIREQEYLSRTKLAWPTVLSSVNTRG